MAIRKEDIYRLVEKLKEQDLKIVYDLLNRLTDDLDDFVVEADDTPLTDEELRELEEINRQIDNGEVTDWEDIKSEYKL